MRLYIDDRPCPIKDKIVIPIGYNATELTQPHSLRQGVELEITIPATNESNAILGFAEDIYSEERFNDSHHTARIEKQGVTLLEGTAILLSTDVNSSLEGEYRLRIVAPQNRWANRAARTQLRSCGISWSMILNEQNIKESWSTEEHKAVRYLPVLRNRYEPEYSGLSAAPLQYIMTTDDYHPFISIKSIFKRAFNGYALQGEFMESELMQKLYMSGQYASPETAKQKRMLDFLARRKAPTTAIADHLGTVYATAAYDGESQSVLGNIVDTADPTAVDYEGNLMSDTFTTANVFGIDQRGHCHFTSSMAATVGFMLHLEYITSYHIRSRRALDGFNRIVAEPGVDITFDIANNFADQRQSLVAGMSYNLCIFDFDDTATYQLRVYDADTGREIARQSIESRYQSVTMPATATNLRCEVVNTADTSGEPFDWALYFAFVDERGQTEVVVDVRIPPEEFYPGESRRFNDIRFKGAQRDMELTLLPATSLRPYFSTVPGYGQSVDMSDITHSRVWLIDIVEAICQMFNLMIFTDESNKRILIEPMESFYTQKVWDWSKRVDYGSKLELTDIGIDEPECVERRYIDADYATKVYNQTNTTDLGAWKTENATYGALQGTKSIVNPLFTTAVNKSEVYAPALSASIMQVGDNAAEGAMDTPFTTHIALYQGLVPLPEGEFWVETEQGTHYPLAAFFFGGDELNEPFSLCFEDRDGVAGLKQYFEPQARRIAQSHRLCATVILSPADVENLFSLATNAPSVRDLFAIEVLGQQALYRLESLKSYDPNTGKAVCTFIENSYE